MTCPGPLAIVFLTDLDGAILTWGEDCEKLFGYRVDEVRNLRLHDLFRFDAQRDGGLPPPPLDNRTIPAQLRCRDGAETRVVLKTALQQSTTASVLICSVLITQAPESTAVVDALILANIIEGLPCLFYVLDQDGRLLLWNTRLAEAVEIPTEELAHAAFIDFFEEKDRPEVRSKIAEAFETGQSSHESFIVGRNLKRTPFLFQCARMTVDALTCVFGTGVDISERIDTELRLRVRERAMNASVNAIMITSCRGEQNIIEYVNPAFERLTGYTQEESLGQDARFMRAEGMDDEERSRIRAALHARTSVRSVLRNTRKNGEVFWNDLRIDPVVSPEGTVTHFVAVINDITETKNYEKRLQHLATHDAMTGLANRSLLHDRLDVAIAVAEREDNCIALAFLDLDNFKSINDSYGHEAGDIVIKTVAERLTRSVRAGDTVARVGGDEFVLVINNCQGIDYVADLLERIRHSVTEPIDIPGKEIFPGVSIGISIFPHDGASCHAILRAADAAMYLAKTSGKNNCQFYSAAANHAVHAHLEMEASLRAAIQRDELYLGFQPKVDLRTGKIVGAESLVRWRHPQIGVIMPNAFIQLAEETGLIVLLGEWVLKRACAILSEIHRAGFPWFSLSVNLSARQLRQPDFGARLAELLHSSALAEGTLELEVTESQLMDNPEQAVATLNHLKSLGVQLSIDDFGTGYSSLSRLQKFPVDYIKIDRSFLGDVGHGPENAVIAQAIISLGHNLNLKVIAEGVETREQLDFLRDHECDQMQGHYFSAAIPGPTLFALLAADKSLQ